MNPHYIGNRAFTESTAAAVEGSSGVVLGYLSGTIKRRGTTRTIQPALIGAALGRENKGTIRVHHY